MEKVYLAFIEGGHGYNTAGKRTPSIKSLGGRQIKEHEFNEPTAQKLIEELKRCGVHVFDAAAGDRDVPLKERVDYANKIYYQYCAKYGKENVVAVYVSIHFNALDGVFGGSDPSGFSVHIYKGHKTKDAGRLAQYIVDELKNGTKQVNRGVVEQDLFITRETAMTAVLSENGFMDNENEALLMIDPKFQLEVAVEHAKGICKYFGIPYVVPVVLKNGWEKIEGKWFFFEQDKKKTGWLKWDKRWWYLGPDGVMFADQWVKYKNQWYYLKSNGEMLANVTLSVDAEGAVKVNG